MTDTAMQTSEQNADCPINLLRGFQHDRARNGGTELLRIVAITMLFAVFLAGPAALLALSKNMQQEDSLANAQAVLCETSAASCGEMTGSVSAIDPATGTATTGQ